MTDVWKRNCLSLKQHNFKIKVWRPAKKKKQVRNCDAHWTRLRIFYSLCLFLTYFVFLLKCGLLQWNLYIWINKCILLISKWVHNQSVNIDFPPHTHTHKKSLTPSLCVVRCDRKSLNGMRHLVNLWDNIKLFWFFTLKCQYFLVHRIEHLDSKKLKRENISEYFVFVVFFIFVRFVLHFGIVVAVWKFVDASVSRSYFVFQKKNSNYGNFVSELHKVQAIANLLKWFSITSNWHLIN